jgi:hypothetical protein
MCILIGTLVAITSGAGPLESMAVRLGLGGGLALMGAGVVLRRLGFGRAAKEGKDADDALLDLLGELEGLIQALEGLQSAPSATEGGGFRSAIRETAESVRSGFARSNQRLLERYGVAVWAEVLGDFARGERWLNRAESAAIDRHWEEVNSCILRSIPWLRRCAVRLQRQLQPQ